MTQLEILLNNIGTLLTRCGSYVLVIWAVYRFLTDLAGEGGRNPSRIIATCAMIIGAGIAYKMIPQFLEIGADTGGTLGGQ